MIIGIDFDGTIVKHEYPKIGAPVPGALETMRKWEKEGHQLILWTMRGGDELRDAFNYLIREGIELFGVNCNPKQRKWTDSPKAYCHMYIDDAAYGCPLIREENQRAYVDWSKIIIEE